MFKKTPAYKKSYKKRLKAFEPKFAGFVDQVWQKRTGNSIGRRGTDQIYRMYSGPRAYTRPYDRGELKRFLRKIIRLGHKRNTAIQGLGKDCLWLETIGENGWDTYGQDLWVEFYHFITGKRPDTIRKRVYLRVGTIDKGLALMEDLVPQLARIQGFDSIKIVGPGDILRRDTIVAYFADEASRRKVLDRLKHFRGKNPLPDLVEPVAEGIGIADEPPVIEIQRGGGMRHSFGSFLSTVLWVALRTTPNVKKPDADGRHFLDNVLYCLRVLGVDPRSPYTFPNAEALERFQALARQRERQEKRKAGGRPAVTA